jgi:hypothetical protein
VNFEIQLGNDFLNCQFACANKLLCKMAVHPMVHQDGAAQAILPAAKVDDTLVTFKNQFSTFFVRMSLANLFCGEQLPPVFH